MVLAPFLQYIRDIRIPVHHECTLLVPSPLRVVGEQLVVKQEKNMSDDLQSIPDLA